MRKLLLSLVFTTFISLSSLAAAPKYIFLFIGDGMGMGHVMAAETYNRLVAKDSDNLLMFRFPVASMAMTYSASSPITDSAAAGTALATGTKTKNSMLGMSPDTVPVTSIATQLLAKGYGVGVITSVAFDDATPAAFYAHSASRHEFEKINYDGARSNFNFIGGAYTHMAETDEAKARAIFDDYRANGFTVAHGIEELHKSFPADKILLTSHAPVSPNEIGYTIDSIPGAMTLEQLTTECLNHLMRVSPEHFFMMVEGGNIDHAAHGNDGGTVVKEVLNFNKTLQIAYDFYLEHPDETLIVVTADHDTGGMTIGVNNGPTGITLAGIDHQRISKDRFNDLCTQNPNISWEEMRTVLSDKLGFWSHINISTDEESRMKDYFDRMKSHTDGTQKTLYNEFAGFTAIVFDILSHKNGFGFTTLSHTGNPVPVFSVGNGCELFRNVNNNIEIPAKIRRLTGLE